MQVSLVWEHKLVMFLKALEPQGLLQNVSIVSFHSKIYSKFENKKIWQIHPKLYVQNNDVQL